MRNWVGSEIIANKGYVCDSVYAFGDEMMRIIPCIKRAELQSTGFPIVYFIFKKGVQRFI